MARVCAHCGELYPETRLNCPHCGADADLTYVDEPGHAGREMDDGAYEEFLESEGLAEPRRREEGTGCALLLATGLVPGLVLLLM